VSRGLGAQQRAVMTALRGLEAVHGPRWIFVHAVCRAAWPALEGAQQGLRPDGAEGANPSRILAGLAKRGLIERNAKRGHGASVRLTLAGKMGLHKRRRSTDA
jgi:hypothetical protein